jgi:hypothetical protein
VIDAVWSLVTVPAVALNEVFVAPAAMDTDPGTVTAALLLASEMAAEEAAALVSVTVQVAVPPLRIDAGVHVTDATCTCVVTASEADRETPL